MKVLFHKFEWTLAGQQVMLLLNKLPLTFQVIYDVTMTSQRYCEQGSSLYRFARRLGIDGQQVMLNKLALTFQVIYDVMMTSQRYCEKGTSLYWFGRRLGNVGQQVMLNKLALTFQVIYWRILFWNKLTEPSNYNINWNVCYISSFTIKCDSKHQHISYPSKL